jgi:hypothetical protein
MREYSDNNSLRILAVYERRPAPDTGNTGEKKEYVEMLRVDGKGLIPRAGPEHLIQINIENDPENYRFPVPEKFNKMGYFIMKRVDLPCAIPYGKDATISIIEKKREERLLAKAPLGYRTI